MAATARSRSSRSRSDATAGSVALKLNLDNPTVSTASDDFVRAADGAPGWEGQAWTSTIEVPLTTLDALIARHGTPAFIKIDVEGFEAEVLAGLGEGRRRTLVRVYHHPARRRGSLHRALRGARLSSLSGGARRKPEL